MNLPIYQVDAFASRPFSGNPAAICILDAAMPDPWMQSVAMEMNLAETAFILPAGNGFKLRWFTPTVEVDLCGHATLAAAHVLWETARLSSGEPADFDTRSGRLRCMRRGDSIELDFPVEREQPVPEPEGLADAIGAQIVYCGRNRFDYLIQVSDADTLYGLKPDFRRLANYSVRGIIVTSVSDQPAIDFLSRFFAPASGIDEDPVTGSAHCCLGPFWQHRLGRSELTGYQASARGGEVGVRIQGDRVILIGQAVTVMSGTLTAALQ